MINNIIFCYISLTHIRVSPNYSSDITFSLFHNDEINLSKHMLHLMRNRELAARDFHCSISFLTDIII